jgi:hypothetical protein
LSAGYSGGRGSEEKKKKRNQEIDVGDAMAAVVLI